MSKSDNEVLQEDLGELLEVVGLPAGARPQSPHEVFQEALEVVRAMREVTDAARILYNGPIRNWAGSGSWDNWKPLGGALTRYGVLIGPTYVGS